MRYPRTTSLFASLALASTALAQTTLVLPPEYDLAWGRSSSAALGGTSTRTQMIFASPFAPGTVVTGIGMRTTTATVDQPAFTATVEIRLSSTAVVPGTMTTAWASNLGNDEVVVLPQQAVALPAMPANRGTGAFAEFVFTTPFVFGLNGNPNICIDFLVYANTSTTWSTDRAFAATSGRAANYGIGCNPGTVNSTSTNGTYVNGSTINFTVSGGPANSLMLLVLSVNEKEVAPGFPAPLPLSLIGAAPGCDLLLPLDIIQPTLSDGAGAAASAITISGYSQFGFAGQWVGLITPTIANPAGVETLRARAVWIGPEIVEPNAQYVYHLSNVNATAATTATVDAVPIVKFAIQ